MQKRQRIHRALAENTGKIRVLTVSENEYMGFPKVGQDKNL